jgi:hypothetical protein
VVDGHPNGVVRVGGETSAADLTLGVLIVSGTVSRTSEVQAQAGADALCSAVRPSNSASNSPPLRSLLTAILTYQRIDLNRLFQRAQAGHLNSLHVEYIHAFEFTEELESLETGRLFFTAGISYGSQ